MKSLERLNDMAQESMPRHCWNRKELNMKQIRTLGKLASILATVLAAVVTFSNFGGDTAAAHPDSEARCHTSQTVRPTKSLVNRRQVKSGVWVSRYCGGYTLKLNIKIAGEWQSPLVAHLSDLGGCAQQTYCREKYTIIRDMKRGCGNYQARARVWKWMGRGDARHLHLVRAGTTDVVRLCRK